MAKSWIYTDLSVRDALYLFVNGVKFKVAQFTMTFAKNEIPQAQCMIAVGRRAATGGNVPPAEGLGMNAAEIHTHFEEIQRLQDAVVIFSPKGEYNARGVLWPEGPTIIFDGVVAGIAYRKLLGKMHVVITLSHFLTKLTWSSCLTKSGHVANASQLNLAAVLRVPNATGAGAIANLSSLLPMGISVNTLTADMWFSLKRILLTLAGLETAPADAARICDNLQRDMAANDPALYALNRIEPLNTTAAMMTVPPGSYFYGVPLKTITVPATIRNLLAATVGNEMLESLSGKTFWDKIVAGFCSLFNLAVVPMIDRALIVADVPAHRGFWQTLSPDEYDALDANILLDLPLRAVGVHTGFDSPAGAAQHGFRLSRTGVPILGGCFVGDDPAAEDLPNVGTVLYVGPPPWLAGRSAWSDQPTRLPNGQTATTPLGPLQTLENIGPDLRDLYNRYAQAVYLANSLRGRNWTLGGKLRFDIAPCANLEVKTRGELLLAPDEDAMATTLYGQVARVTVQINAEAPAAGTAFQLTHLRTATENEPGADRTNTDRHPLFDLSSIHGRPAPPTWLTARRPGSPLLAKYDL